jgi:hypothetical protein
VSNPAPTAPAGTIYDRGYRHYEGPREGRGRRVRAIVVAGVRLGRDVFRPSRELLLAAAAFAGAAVLHLSPVLLLLAGGVAGTVLFRPKEDQA